MKLFMWFIFFICLYLLVIHRVVLFSIRFFIAFILFASMSPIHKICYLVILDLIYDGGDLVMIVIHEYPSHISYKYLIIGLIMRYYELESINRKFTSFCQSNRIFIMLVCFYFEWIALILMGYLMVNFTFVLNLKLKNCEVI
jgi:hypothetical protein